MSILDRADHVEVPVHLEMSFKNSPPGHAALLCGKGGAPAGG